MRISEDVKLDFSDVLIVPQRSALISRADVDLIRTYRFPHTSHTWTGIGIIASNMDAVGTFAMAKALNKHKMLTALHKHYGVAELSDFFLDSEIHLNLQNTFYTVGSSDSDYKKLIEVRNEVQKKFAAHHEQQIYHTQNVRDVFFPYLLCIDVANGYTQNFIDCVRRYRKEFSKAIIMAGNVVTPNMAEELILSGADCAKIGIGSGSVCTTRIKSGIGFPQLSAVDECAFAVHGKPNGHICSDGGCTNSGDVSKALAAGADFVMLGGLLAGTDECDGEWIDEYEVLPGQECSKVTGRIVKTKLKFYGMSSKDAQEKYNGGLADYKASEGKTVYIKYKGPVDNVAKDIMGGIRSACTYVGATKIKDLPKCASFIRVNNTHNKVFE